LPENLKTDRDAGTMRMSDSTGCRILLVTADTPAKSSFVSRLAWLKNFPEFAFEIVDELGWPSNPTNAERQTSFEKILQAKTAADVVILHRVLFDESGRARFFSDAKPVIFDMDDAIYSVPSSIYRAESKSMRGWARRGVRVALRGRPDYAGRYRPLVEMLKRVHAVSAGNPHLARFASQYCSSVAVVPTVVDVTNFPVKQHADRNAVTIGWYGSPDNHWYLNIVAPSFRRLREVFAERVRFSLISSEPYEAPGLTFDWIPWHKETELDDLLSFDIGIMPLSDDEWARGKSGNKALYYMASGIPPVVSPVGVNAEIVQHGQNGLCAQTDDEWFSALCLLVDSAETRSRLGINARESIVRNYSRATAAAKLANLVAGDKHQSWNQLQCQRQFSPRPLSARTSHTWLRVMY
jgi:glycosyltransferase involved in cell wall biosynthesis